MIWFDFEPCIYLRDCVLIGYQVILWPHRIKWLIRKDITGESIIYFLKSTIKDVLHSRGFFGTFHVSDALLWSNLWVLMRFVIRKATPIGHWSVQPVTLTTSIATLEHVHTPNAQFSPCRLQKEWNLSTQQWLCETLLSALRLVDQIRP